MKRPFPPFIRGARASFVFLTRLPVGGFPYERRDFEWAAAHFPSVGAVIGAVGALVFYASHGLGGTVAALLALGTTAWLTGAFHEDGLADTFDALGGYHNRDRVFEILKDSRIGSYGSVALLVVFGLRAAALAGLDAKSGAAAFISAHVLARIPPVWLVAGTPYVSAEGQAKGSGIAGARRTQALVATVLGAGYLALLQTWAPMPSLSYVVLGIALALCAWALRSWFVKRVGGVTGDLLGATEQLSEVLVLMVYLYFARYPAQG